MKIRSNSLTALALSAVVACAIGFAPTTPAFAADKPQNSKVAGKPLQEAKKSLDAKKYPDAIAKLKEIQGISGKNDYDEHLINEMLSYAYVKTNNLADAAKVIEGDLDSQFVTPPERQKAITVTVDTTGAVFFDDALVAPEALEQRLSNIKATIAEPSLHLRADERVPYGAVAKVMAAIEHSGISKVSVLTDNQ